MSLSCPGTHKEAYLLFGQSDMEASILFIKKSGRLWILKLKLKLILKWFVQKSYKMQPPLHRTEN